MKTTFPPGPPAPARVRRGGAEETGGNRAALAGLSLAVLLSTLNTSIVNVALPTLTRVFDASTQSAQWTVISFVLAITALIVSAGRLADIVGRKRLLLGGVALFTVAAGGCALAPSLNWLVAIRFVQGIGAAVMMAISLAMVGDLTASGKAGRAMGVLGSMSAIGTALGPALGGLLIASWGWRAIFLISLPLGVIAFVLLRRALPRDGVTEKTRWSGFDGTGTLVLALSLVAYALALTRRPGGFGRENAALLMMAAGGLVWFVRLQRGCAWPLVRMELLEIGGLRSGLGASLLVAAVVMSTMVVGPFYLAQSLAVEARTMGLVLSIGPVVAAAVAGPAGRLVDRVGPRVTTQFGLGGVMVGCLALALLSGRGGLIGYVLPVTVLTAGYSLFQTANNTAVMRIAVPDQRGVISGLLNLSRNLGLVTGASLLGGLFAWLTSGDGSSAAESAAAGARVTFAVATGLVALALLVALRGPGEQG